MVNFEATLFCGQSFSWQKSEGFYQGVISNHLITLPMDDPFSHIRGNPFLEHYFDLAFPYQTAEEILSSRDPNLKGLIEAHGSIHILNQDPWEITLGFITSQNNTIKRIRTLLDLLRVRYGKEISPTHYALPTADELITAADEDALRALGFGYRAPFLLDAAKKVSLLERVSTQDDAHALETLKEIIGVGPKVAACILLFGFGRKDIFPLDTWTKRIMKQQYPDRDPSFFSPYGGIAQQHLFFAERRKKRAQW